jgi:hypothetical protein
MATTAVFNIPKAKGLGEYKLVHVTFSGADFGVSTYVGGGITVTVPDVKNIVAPLGAYVQSGAYNVNIGSVSGRAMRLLIYQGSTDISGLALSGAVVIKATAVCVA